MIDLHERLSEFSYGYGVTREAELLLDQIGLRAVPFLPNLVQEHDLGFDVAFDRPGAALMLQFKLGQSLARFHRPNKAVPAPPLERPFWRFAIDTSEPDGQFETLLKAEHDGAEVYYTAPRFSDWPHYARFFEHRQVLENSVLVKPSEIRTSLDFQGAIDGPHRIIYDRSRVHVCSKPIPVEETSIEEAVVGVSRQVREKREPTRALLARIFEGLGDRSVIRRDDVNESVHDLAMSSDDVGLRMTGEYARVQRSRRLSRLMERSLTRDHAVAAAIGLELWTLGIQLVVAVDDSITA